jgi:tetratricopeptide (TPR) repeat protein
LLDSCSTIDINKEKAIGIRQYENDSLKDAINVLTKVIAINDTCTECFLYRGFAYKDQKQYDKALKDFNLLISIDTNKAIGFANRASIYYLKNDYKSALRDFLKAYHLDSNSNVFFNPISHMLFATGQKDEACIFYEKALTIGDTTFDNSIKVYCDKKNGH